MDPDATLARIRTLIAEIGDEKHGEPIDDLISLADHVEALDTWLSGGGFLPLAWQNFGGAK